MGSILDTVKNKQTNNITPTTTGGSIFRTVSGQISNQINEPQNKYLSGGFISDVADILGTGQYAITGGIESQLEKRGILRPSTTSGLKGGVKERKSNIGLLKRIGEETGKGGLLTGQYQPTQSVWGNFVRELPVTALGLAGDIMIDPLVVASKLGAVAKVTKTIGSAVKTGATAVASNMPAVQKIGDVLERLAITRGGQSEAFKLADKQRIINESLALEKTEKLVSDLIEAPSVIQQRMAQVLKGGILHEMIFVVWLNQFVRNLMLLVKQLQR